MMLDSVDTIVTILGEQAVRIKRRTLAECERSLTTLAMLTNVCYFYYTLVISHCATLFTLMLYLTVTSMVYLTVMC